MHSKNTTLLRQMPVFLLHKPIYIKQLTSPTSYFKRLRNEFRRSILLKSLFSFPEFFVIFSLKSLINRIVFISYIRKF